jgi:hypothetical protein
MKYNTLNLELASYYKTILLKSLSRFIQIDVKQLIRLCSIGYDNKDISAGLQLGKLNNDVNLTLI